MKKLIPFLAAAVLFAGCTADKAPAENSDAAAEAAAEVTADAGAETAAAEDTDDNTYDLRDAQTNGSYGSLILNDDASVEILLDDSDVTYVGYVEPLEYPENYHLTAAKPHTNFTGIVEGKDTELYYLDCDILINEEGHFAALFNNFNGSDPRQPFTAEAGIIVSSGPVRSFNGYFARFITVVDENGNECYKIAQKHTSEATLFSGEIRIGDRVFGKEDGLTFHDESQKHISGGFDPELRFSATNTVNYADQIEDYDTQTNLTLVLSRVDEDKGLYTEKSAEFQDAVPAEELLDADGL